MFEELKLLVAALTAVLAIASFVIARRADRRAKKAEDIASLLGEKENVAFAALKILRDGLPRKEADRSLLISALMQACVFEGSDRARALLYRIIEKHRAEFGREFEFALETIERTFHSMDQYAFSRDELDLSRGQRRICAVRKVVRSKPTEPIPACP